MVMRVQDSCWPGSVATTMSDRRCLLTLGRPLRCVLGHGHAHFLTSLPVPLILPSFLSMLSVGAAAEIA